MGVFPLQWDSVHLWSVTLDRSKEETDSFAALLSEDEAERASRFSFPIRRNRFIVGRGTLRVILGQYVGTKPADLRFTYGPQGKPELVGEELRFNLSHSEGAALVAVARSRSVGIDLERVNQDVQLERIARRICSSRELAALDRVPPDKRLEAFYNAWIRKEAFVKATGKGFSLPVEQVEVSLEPGSPARLLGVPAGEGPVSRWSIAALKLKGGFVGALVVEGRGWFPAFCEGPVSSFGTGQGFDAGFRFPETQTSDPAD